MPLLPRVLSLALLLACPGAAPAAPAAEQAPAVPRTEPAPCPKLEGADELAKASCFYLVVPENRARPPGRTVKLLVAKYPARQSETLADPVVYLAGGPGDIAPLEANGLIAADFIRGRDVYVMSQRGTMFALPALIFYAFFRGKVQKLISDLEGAATHLMAILRAQVDRHNAPTSHGGAPARRISRGEDFAMPTPSPLSDDRPDLHGI